MCKEAEACLLGERMTTVEKELAVVKQELAVVKNQNRLQLVAYFVLISILTIITFKLLNSQVLLLTGENGLHAISGETRHDVEILPIHHQK